MKLSSSYPILELSTQMGLPYGVLLTASDCLQDKHNGHCSTAWRLIKATLDERQQVLLMFVLLSVAAQEYNFPEAIMDALIDRKPVKRQRLPDDLMEIYIVDLG